MDEILDMSTKYNIVLDFFADYCGPCKLIEPALQRLAPTPGVIVIKARLFENRMLCKWLEESDIKISNLPTLVVVKGGKPVDVMRGAKEILDDKRLMSFALQQSDDIGI